MRNEIQIKNEIGQNIKCLLSKNNCSQQELAKALGTDKSTVSNWVRGKRIPRLDLVDRMCVIFGCTRNDILSNEELVIDISKLSKDNQEKLMEYFNLLLNSQD